ncbi:TonB-dependent receptor family protein [Coraliomargarita akajimensis]|nr:TonB-dependent receptor [Coraliomargarita akajimensis]
MSRFVAAPFCLALSIFQSLTASTQEAASLHTLPDYTVTATGLNQPKQRVPFAVSTIGLEQIQQATTQLSLDEPLQTVPGVFVLNPYNYAQDSRISIRGFGARANFGIRGVRLIADGIPATTPDGQGSVDAVDLGSTERIEVLRGPASAIYGAASGGVILLESESGPVDPFLETRWTTGSDALLQGQLKAGGQYADLNYLMNGTYLDYGGYRDHSETENRRLNAKFQYALTADSTLTALVNRIDIPVQNDPGGLTLQEALADRTQARQRNLDYNSGESVDQTTLGLRYEHRLAEPHRIELKTYTVQRDFANRLPFETGGQVSFQRDFWGLGGQYRFAAETVEAAVGFNYDLQQDDRANYDNLNGDRGDLSLQQDEEIENLGLFAVGSYTLFDALTVSAALRHDFIDYAVDDHFLADGDDSGQRRFDQTSPMAGVIWEFVPSAALYANVARSFETPTSTELANPNGGGFNPDLDPQVATSYEIGLKGSGTWFSDRALRYELVAFHIDIEDSIVPYELVTDPGRDYFRNAGRSERDGVEAGLQVELLDGLMLDLSYTWSDFEYTEFIADGTDYSGNQLPGIPEHFANFQLNYRHPSGFFTRWNTRYTGSLQADDANTTTVDASTVSDLRIGWLAEHGNWTFEPYLGLNNVFDEFYFANIRINAFGGRYYEPAPERNMYAGIRLRYTFR